MRLGPWEIGLILVIVLIIFGAGRLTNIGRDLGKAIRGFRESSKTGDDGKEEAAEVVTKKSTTRRKAQDTAKTT